MVSVEPDDEHSDVQGGVVEHTPRPASWEDSGEDNLDEVISWARGEWARRTGR
jgi:hypothetical protein